MIRTFQKVLMISISAKRLLLRRRRGEDDIIHGFISNRWYFAVRFNFLLSFHLIVLISTCNDSCINPCCTAYLYDSLLLIIFEKLFFSIFPLIIWKSFRCPKLHYFIKRIIIIIVLAILYERFIFELLFYLWKYELWLI